MANLSTTDILNMAVKEFRPEEFNRNNFSAIRRIRELSNSRLSLLESRLAIEWYVEKHSPSHCGYSHLLTECSQ